jgi:tetratricopeptide (TPR) repeat protein
MGKHFDRAEILFQQDRYDLAEKELREEIGENPDFDPAYSLLALCIIGQQKSATEALQLIETALSIDAENDLHHYVLAVYWDCKGDLERARSAIEVAIQLNSDSEHYFYLLARILFDLGDNSYEQEALYLLVFFLKSYCIRRYLQPALLPLEKSLSLNPNFLPALNLLTNLFIKTGRKKRALETRKIALQIDPDNANAYNLHGQILAKCGKYSQAIEYFKSALRIVPDFDKAKENLLEAMRSRFWIYPWISLTHLRGKFLFVLNLLPGFSTVLMIPYMGAGHTTTPDQLFVAAIAGLFIIAFPARYIFNLFLQFNPKNKNLLTITDLVVANYAAALSVTVVSAVYTSTFFYYTQPRHTAIIIAGLLGGIVTSIVSFLPVNDRSESKSLYIRYQVGVVLLGLIDIFVYLQFQNLDITKYLLYLFAFLVLSSPLVAIYGSLKVFLIMFDVIKKIFGLSN